MKIQIKPVKLRSVAKRKCAGCGLELGLGERMVYFNGSAPMRYHFTCGMAWLATRAVHEGRACWWPGGQNVN